jgi:hypothetical protein
MRQISYTVADWRFVFASKPAPTEIEAPTITENTSTAFAPHV